MRSSFHWAVDQFVTHVGHETVVFTWVKECLWVNLPFVLCANQRWTLFICASMHVRSPNCSFHWPMGLFVVYASNETAVFTWVTIQFVMFVIYTKKHVCTSPPVQLMRPGIG